MPKKSGLGKGLSVLIPVSKETNDPTDRYEEVPVEKLDPNPDQPRQRFHEGQLKELADSIKHNGVIQPIIVTPVEGRFVVIAGERRWRATKLAGYPKIPAIVRQVEKGQMLSMALLENIQRQELNPVEEALAYRRLLDANDFTHETLAAKLGKSRVTISNTLRLLKLPDKVKNLIQDGRLTFGHARCLVAIEDESRIGKLAESCIQKEWSVRELEQRIKKEREARKNRVRTRKDPSLKQTEKKLATMYGAKVTIAGDRKKGKIVFPYASEEEYKRLLDSIMSLGPMERDANGG